MSRAVLGQDPSVRVLVARAAAQAVAGMAGVALTAGPGGRWQTFDAQAAAPVAGVMVVAEDQARYEVNLHLVVAWPAGPLARLGEEVRRRVWAEAARAGLAGALGEIHVHIDGLEDPLEDPRAA